MHGGHVDKSQFADSPLSAHNQRISVLKLLDSPSTNFDAVQDQLLVSSSGAQLNRRGPILFFPIHQFRYTYAIQHLARLFFRIHSSSEMSDLDMRARSVCRHLDFVFGRKSSTTPKFTQVGAHVRMHDQDCVVGCLSSKVLDEGTFYLLTQPEDWDVSVLTYVIVYFMLTLEPFLANLPDGTQTLGRIPRSDMKLVATIEKDGAPFVVMPHTMAACYAVRSYLCTSPLTDTVLAEVQRVSTILIQNYLPEIWLALVPFLGVIEDGERRLHQYFQKLTDVHTHDTFRSSFLNLLF